MALLSICIPVYNQDINALARELLQQRQSLGADIELVVLDDGSGERQKQPNRRLKNEYGTNYHELPNNIGRASIRNRLAKEASGSYLLFLDDDSRMIRENFLETYLQHCTGQAVVCGGREYSRQMPPLEYALHYHYGKSKESRPAAQRSQNPYEAFHSNNFLCPKDVITYTPFDESLNQYGHEDTLFGFQLKKNNVEVKHIDNPVLHHDLETNEEFLSKTRMAIENLKNLYDRNDRDFNEMVKMLRAYQRLRNLKATPAMAGLFRRNRDKWEDHLLKTNPPSMRIFNLYKLGYLCSL